MESSKIDRQMNQKSKWEGEQQNTCRVLLQSTELRTTPQTRIGTRIRQLEVTRSQDYKVSKQEGVR